MSQNVWEWLGLPADHRKEGKIVQLVKHMDEVPEKKIKYPLLGQVKWDGVYCMVVTRDDGEVAAFGRTGRMLCNTHAVTRPFTKNALYSSVVIGELCCPEMSLECLSGCVNPNRTSPLGYEEQAIIDSFIHLRVHDCIPLADLISGTCAVTYSERNRMAASVAMSRSSIAVQAVPTVMLYNLSEVEQFAVKHIEAGEEGVVLKQDLPWTAGHKGHHAMKRVRRVTYDLLCVGAEEGKGKRQGMVANLLFRWKDGKTIKADMGKSWTDEQRRLLWADYNKVFGNHDPEGGIFTVYGLMDSSKGVIRLPKVGELRHDKVEADF